MADVFAVAYGDDIHVYPQDQEDTANTLFLVGVAAYGDGDIRRVDEQRWAVAREKLRRMGHPVVDHRER